MWLSLGCMKSNYPKHMLVVVDKMNTPPPEQQNRRTTRSALAEIPTRLGMLSVSENGRLPPVTAIGNTTELWFYSCLHSV
jgi:hypothetical protein